MEKFKSERGSATVVTLTVVLFFTIILMGVYVSANNANRAQKNADTTVINKYEDDVNNIDIIYNEQLKRKNDVENINNINLKTTDITALDIENNPELYYGKEVEYTSINGQNDWKIFHSDGENIYLITGNYVKITDSSGVIDTKKVDTKSKLKKADNSANYRLNWDGTNMPSFNTDAENIQDTVFSKFKVNKDIYNINSYKNNKNSKCVSALLNTSYWTNYKDKEEKAEYVIGGPTIELWMDSWNARYPNQTVYCDSANENGYYLRTSSDSPTPGIKVNQNINNGGELYFANNCKGLKDGDDSAVTYWIASPSAYANYALNLINYNGSISYYTYSCLGTGIRPVVALKTGTKLNLKNNINI